MLSIYQIKPKFQQALRPILAKLHRAGISANAITWSAIMLSAATGLVLLFWKSPFALLVVPAALLVRMALNALDGMMAREHDQQTKLGEALNEMGDIVSDSFIFWPFLTFPFVDPMIFFGFILLSALNETAGILAKSISGERRYDGPMGKSDRALLIGLLCLGLFFFPKLAAYFNHIIGVACGLLLVSTFVRLKKSL